MVKRIIKRFNKNPKCTFRFDDGRVWTDVPQRDIVELANRPGSLNCDVINEHGQIVGRL